MNVRWCLVSSKDYQAAPICQGPSLLMAVWRFVDCFQCCRDGDRFCSLWSPPTLSWDSMEIWNVVGTACCCFCAGCWLWGNGREIMVGFGVAALNDWSSSSSLWSLLTFYFIAHFLYLPQIYPSEHIVNGSTTCRPEIHVRRTSRCRPRGRFGYYAWFDRFPRKEHEEKEAILENASNSIGLYLDSMVDCNPVAKRHHILACSE